MKNYLLAAIIIVLLASGCVANPSDTQDSENNASYVFDNKTYNFTHYQVEIRSNHKSLGGIEPYIHAGDKREITLKTGKIDRIISTCNELFQNARTEHGNICGDLRERLR